MTVRTAPSIPSPLRLETADDIGRPPLPLDHFDPQRHPHLKLALLNQATLLCKAALSGSRTSPVVREQTALLFEWADRLHQAPSASAHELRSLAMTLAELPAPLTRLAGHLGACHTAQGELGRLRSALDNAGPDARMTAQARASFRRYAGDNQKLLDEARGMVETGRLSDLPDLALRIQARNATLRGGLERAGLPIPTGMPDEAIVPPPARRPAPAPASKKFHPGIALRRAFSQLARTADSARKAVVLHLSPHEIRRQRTEAQLRLQTSLLPLRDELSLLDRDLSAARARVLELESARGAHTGQRPWATQTLNGLLAPALQAQARADKALKAQGQDPLATARNAVTTIRASLAKFNETLRVGERATVAFAFPQRPWEAPKATSVR